MRDLRFQHSTTKAVVDNTLGVATLATGVTYYAELGLGTQEWMGLSSIHWKYDGTIVAAITIEGTNFYEAGLTDAAATSWVPITAIATVSPAAVAGQSLSSWADSGYGRLRAKVVVTTGGALRGCFHSKKAS